MLADQQTGNVLYAVKLLNPELSEPLLDIILDVDGLTKLPTDSPLTKLDAYNGEDVFPPYMGESDYCEPSNP